MARALNDLVPAQKQKFDLFGNNTPNSLDMDKERKILTMTKVYTSIIWVEIRKMNWLTIPDTDASHVQHLYSYCSHACHAAFSPYQGRFRS